MTVNYLLKRNAELEQQVITITFIQFKNTVESFSFAAKRFLDLFYDAFFEQRLATVFTTILFSLLD